MCNRKFWFSLLLILPGCGLAPVLGSEADIKIPDLDPVTFSGLGNVSGLTLMYLGILICAAGAVFGLTECLVESSEARGRRWLGLLSWIPMPLRSRSRER